MVDSDYIEVNRELWNIKAQFHFDTPYYNVKEFLENEHFLSLSHIELELLGDITEKRIIHLQCHFGLDTMSLARLGAKQVIGIDLSNIAIDKARQLAKQTGLCDRVQFVCCDIYDLEQHLPVDNGFDLIFTSFGTTKWFPDLKKWSYLIRQYSKTNGAFLIVDFHPILWTFDDKFEQIARYSYFNKGPIVEYSKGTYADPEADIEKKSIRWNHSLADIITALLNQNFLIKTFKEFDSLPMIAFANLQQSPNDGQFRFRNFEEKIPLVYALKAERIEQDIKKF